MPPSAFARVLVESPLPQLDRLFDYRVPAELAHEVRPGVRVKVPLRSAGRVADGFVVELADEAGFAGEPSAIDAVVSPVPVLAPSIWRLARRVADRAAGSASDVLRLAIPGRQARVEKAWLASERPEQWSAPDGAPAPDAPIDGYEGRLAELIAAGGRVALDVTPRPVAVAGGAGSAWVGSWALTLARAAERVVAGGGSAILLVPDHRDVQQLALALGATTAAERIVRLDAKQSNPDRYRGFLRCLSGEPVVVVGNRSAVYAPVARVGLIAVWDDGDPLFAEPLAPYVHARDAALVRHEIDGGALVFASHSRSTETERLVSIGWLDHVAPQRISAPRVILAGHQDAVDAVAAHARIPSIAWQEARAALATGPVLVQVARPGYATRLVCDECGELARCPVCEGPLRTRSASAVASCSWCGALAASWSCPTCASRRWRRVGSGSVRTAEELGRAFAGARVIVSDGEHEHLAVTDAPALVVATRGAEPVAAGGYRAVLLLDGERMIARESLRVAEDCLRWWSNAAALAAPGAPVVLAGVSGGLAAALATWRQADFARAELGDRRRLHFPPAVRVASVTGSPAAVADAVATVREAVRDVLGPVELDEGRVRAILRFDYGSGAAVATALRAEVVRQATARRKPVGGRPARPPGRPSLRVRLDDPEPFG